MASKAWTDEENAAIVALYFAMLDAAIEGRPYNKRAMIREKQDATLQLGGPVPPLYAGWLKDRSKGSIEAKLMNCSACHAALDPNALTMDGFGYRALSNYQATLKTAMRDALLAARTYPSHLPSQLA
jgi:hypothetical protein